MIISRNRILTTHVGSLPRNETLSELLVAQEEGQPYDLKVLADEMDKAVRYVEPNIQYRIPPGESPRKPAG